MKRFAFPLSAVLVAVLHLGLVYHFAPPSELFGGETISNYKYDLRAAETRRVTEAMAGSGELWAYDPGFRAGALTGVFVDTNSRAWQLLAYGVSKIGVQRAVAFNLFILLAHLVAPLALVLAAWLMGLDRWSVWTAYILGLGLWFYDSYLHWSWWSGTPDWALASALQPLVVAAAFNFMQRGGVGPLVLAAVASLLAHLCHAFSAFALLVPLTLMYRQFFRAKGVRQHVALIAVVVSAALTAILSCGPRLEHLWLTNASSTYGQGTLSFVLTDFLGFTQDTRVTGGVGLRSGFRFLSLGAAVITLVWWRRDKDARTHVIAWSMAALAAFTYLGGYVPGFKTIQPYRFAASLTLLALIPAADLVGEIRRQGALRNLPTMAKMSLLLIALASIPRLGRDVVYFTEALAPKPDDLPKEKPHIADMIGFGSIGYPNHREHRHRVAGEEFKNVAGWFQGWEPRHGRILVDYWPLAEYLAAHTNAYIIGGSGLRDRQSGDADLFQIYPEIDPSREKMREYIEKYAVGLAVATFTPVNEEMDIMLRLNGLDGILTPVFRKVPFQILKSEITVSYFREGSGKIKTSTNRIEIEGTPEEQDLVIKFHWIRTLECKPNCTLEREPVEGDRMGFIRIKAPHPRNLTLVNAY